MGNMPQENQQGHKNLKVRKGDHKLFKKIATEYEMNMNDLFHKLVEDMWDKEKHKINPEYGHLVDIKPTML